MVQIGNNLILKYYEEGKLLESVKASEYAPEEWFFEKIEGSPLTVICFIMSTGEYKIAYKISKNKPDSLLYECGDKEGNALTHAAGVLEVATLYSTNATINEVTNMIINMAKLNKASITPRVLNILLEQGDIRVVKELARINPLAINKPDYLGKTPIETADYLSNQLDASSQNWKWLQSLIFNYNTLNQFQIWEWLQNLIIGKYNTRIIDINPTEYSLLSNTLSEFTIIDKSKYVVVFDIDDTICTNTDMEIKQMQNSKYPIGVWQGEYKWENYKYICLPYLKELFDYLISYNIRIVFFSAGYEDRNIVLLEQILPQILGKIRYEELKKSGQFEIFSDCHTIQPDDRKEGEGRLVKDLEIVKRAQEDIDNILLIEDDQSFVKHDQKPFIKTIDLNTWQFSSFFEDKEVFQLNSAFHLLGIFKRCFNDINNKNISFKKCINQVYLDEGIYNIMDYWPTKGERFAERLICEGFEEIRKINEEANVYKMECNTKESLNLEKIHDEL